MATTGPPTFDAEAARASATKVASGEKRQPGPSGKLNSVIETTERPVSALSDTAGRVSTLDGIRVVGLTEDDEVFYKGFTAAQRRRVRLKTDVRLLPVLCILYLFAQLDRGNIGNARIEGFQKDLHMTEKQWNIVLAVFFLPYFILEVPSNMFLKTLKRPSLYISGLVLAWGAVMTCHGVLKDFGGAVALRLLLGAFESGFFPAAMFICSQWYPRQFVAFRMSIFMAVASVSGAFSGVLAAAISTMGGVGGLKSWQWIFLIEGGVTILLGVLTTVVLVDSPRTSKWLTEDEKRYLELMSFIRDNGSARVEGGPTVWDDLKSITTDWRYWTLGLVLHNVGACGLGLKFAVPTIIKGLGWSRQHSQLLSAVPYIAGTCSALAVSFFSDRCSVRSPFVLLCLSSIGLGYMILLIVAVCVGKSTPGVLVGMSLVTSGVFPMAPLCGSWVSNNFGTPARRAVGIAFIMAVGSIGGLTGSFVYDYKDAPGFFMAFGVCLGLAVVAILMVLVLIWSYLRSNAERVGVTEEQVRSEYSDKELMELGDKSPLFRYTL
ncbi:major facilitator superfamily domain-containing protein [Emericellopsis atlantica]|uniref:Major facilitator superfamily domain-containing protein n=1 Tax=Emericellopsis atlantica TaxID=2614577 RepID=A0A9P8CJN8_9HYPO|nr:major facilitator superfamily domain-containing protein [Emericellopsis atlantica]KAG9249538.1 major facilitator superfamily domain-containing protein [Emericellopsis atlantica]